MPSDRVPVLPDQADAVFFVEGDDHDRPGMIDDLTESGAAVSKGDLIDTQAHYLARVDSARVHHQR
jgi:hypothetical protein